MIRKRKYSLAKAVLYDILSSSKNEEVNKMNWAHLNTSHVVYWNTTPGHARQSDICIYAFDVDTAIKRIMLEEEFMQDYDINGNRTNSVNY